MLPSLLKCSKPLYFYDDKTKELLYVSASQTDMAKALGVTSGNLSSYKLKNILYLNRFRFTSTPLNSEEYFENLLDAEVLKEFVKDTVINYRKESIKQVDNKR